MINLVLFLNRYHFSPHAGGESLQADLIQNFILKTRILRFLSSSYQNHVALNFSIFIHRLSAGREFFDGLQNTYVCVVTKFTTCPSWQFDFSFWCLIESVWSEQVQKIGLSDALLTFLTSFAILHNFFLTLADSDYW